jgi:serine/threonine protein kinase
MSSESINDSVNDNYSDSCSESSDQACEMTNNLNLHGKILDNYNIIYEIGRGGYSIVWLAYHIGTSKYYALKVQDPNEFDDGLDEVKFVSRLPTEPECFNNLVEYFIKTVDNCKYLCSVWNLHATNLDTLLRKGNYENGIPIDITNKIIKQIITALDILHNKYKVFHGDIKPDNIFVKGINDRDKLIIEQYNKANFVVKYRQAKIDYWLHKGRTIKSIDKMDIKTKVSIREVVHKDIIDSIKFENNGDNNFTLTLDNCRVSLGDFGTYCTEDNYYEDSFGTRYYQAPEIILGGKCSYPVDIWALGCTYYELLTGTILFDPIKDSQNARDYYHLCLINDTCGSFSPSFLKSTKKYKQFFTRNNKLIKYKAPEINRLERKLNDSNLTDKETIALFISNIITINPSTRPTINRICEMF